MYTNPISPELVRIVHERQLHEVAFRRAHLELAGPGVKRPAIRRVVGTVLIRAG